MRKAQKQQAQELITQIDKAHEQIRDYVKQGSTQYAMELLEDCQNGGISIGTLIEETEGEDHPTVALLEAYCEVVYQIHEDLAANEEINANKMHKLLRQKLIKIENSLRNDVPIRKEVVFLPYKASMWDSLESVWKAADEDENCDAYVIPIPYYDKNPDGSFREMHYEGDQYPKGVPIVSYKEYDFENRKPDAIYIHNPYDKLNLVTSVPPFFFSENLKKYTEKLVYIPYFVLSEIKPDDDAAIEGMKHFVTTPAVFHADKVIVQSEDMKQVYIKVLLDATNDYSEAAKKYWNDKILGLGSPKIDKVLNTKKEDLEISQEWLRIIEKPDGSWKKIVFYNTSVGALLQHNEKMLEKMRYVFGVFKENRDEVALLWRPHPLIKATVGSMRPQLWQEYDRLVREYRDEGWGIYDDSSDVDRAIALSDAYYGDDSSVVQMYKKTKKPIMIQNVDIAVSIPDRIPLWFLDAYIENDEIWFSENDFNALYKGNLKTGEVKKVAEFCNEKNLQDYLHIAVQKWHSKLCFIPSNAEKLTLYDIEKNIFEVIEIPFRNAVTEDKIQSSVIYKDKLFLFGRGLNIFEYDFISKKIECCTEPSQTLKSVCPDKECFSIQCVLEKNIVYIVVLESNILIEFDLETYIVNYYQIGDKKNRYLTLAKKQNIIFLAGWGEIVCWNMKKNDIEIIQESESNEKKGYNYAKCFGEKIVFFDAINKKMLQVDMEDKTYKLFILPRTNQFYSRGWDSIIFISANNNNRYYLDVGDYSLHDLQNDDYLQQFTISKEELSKMIKEENDYFSLLERTGGVEGGVSAVYSLEGYIYKVIHCITTK